MHAAGDVLKGCPEDVCSSMQAVFYHKASGTLLVTDAAVYISSDPPEVLLLRGMSDHCCMPSCFKAYLSLSGLVLTEHFRNSVQQMYVSEKSVKRALARQLGVHLPHDPKRDLDCMSEGYQ